MKLGTLSAGVVASMLAGWGLPAAPASAADAGAAVPKWCSAIANGIFCAPPSQEVPHFCGTKPVSFAWADGFAANPWRQLSAAAAINEASRCPNVTGFEHTDAQGNTQKAISDLQGLAAKGTNAIIVFADAGPALLPAIRSAYKQGSTVVPFRVDVGGKEGVDYSAFVAAAMHQDGVTWGNWMAKAMGGKGEFAYLSGPPGNSQGRQRSEGIQEAMKAYPDIKFVGQVPFEVTNWDNAKSVQVLSALIAKYPDLKGVVADMTFPIVTSGVFERASKPIPFVAGEDYNALGCAADKMKKDGSKDNLEFGTTSSQSWGIRLAARWAIALAAGGSVDEPLVVQSPDGKDHTVSEPGSKTFSNFPVEDTTKGEVYCAPQISETAPGGTSLTTAQAVEALKGGL